MKKLQLIAGLLCISISVPALALPPTGPIPDDEKSDLISKLRVVRLAADRETRDCVNADRVETAKLLTDLSQEIINTNLAIRTAGYTYEELTNRLAQNVRPIQVKLLLERNSGACEPSRVLEEVDNLVISGGAVFFMLRR
jgi:hypothetical protein